jgi:cytochrome bd ubiquinol oxidase subunit II
VLDGRPRRARIPAARVTLQDAAATSAVLGASLGALLLVPSLWWLYATFQQDPPTPSPPRPRPDR